MTWWRRGAGDDGDLPAVDEFPDLLADDSRAARAAVAARIPAFTPDWSVGSAAAADAGVALVKAFGEQVRPVAQRANRLREKYAREQLRIAGVTGRGQQPGTVLVVITLLDTAPDSVRVPAGTQLTATGAGGAGQVVFETVRDLYATPGRVGSLVMQAGTRAQQLTPAELTPATPLLPFGRQPRPGNALWIGFAGPAPAPRLSLAVEVVPATTGPGGIGPGGIVAGGVADPAPAAEPVLGWEILTAGGLAAVEVHADDTRGLQQSGVVELGIAPDWPPLPHPGLPAGPATGAAPPPLRWLRCGLLLGRYPQPPQVAAIRPNAVLADGAETIRDEILEAVQDPGAGAAPARRFRLSRTPVLRRTVRLAVDAPDPGDLFDLAPTTSADGGTPWVEVPTLARSRPYDQHFVVDEATGIVTFGDGQHGAAVPAGFRHVRALSYRTGGGRGTAVQPEAGFVPRQTIPFLDRISNPAGASGAADAEPVDQLMVRGPALVRARGRAVAAADVEALLPAASGDIGRAVAIAGADIDRSPRPGQVTVIVVGTPRAGGGPPVPSEGTLGAAVRFLLDGDEPRLPVGARLAVRAARFVTVQLEVAVRLDDDADRPAVVLAMTRALDGYLHPLTGGEDRRGWPLGEPVRYLRLVSVVAAVPGVASVGRINVVVGGRPAGPGRDATLPPYTFPWPGRHVVVPLGPVGGARR